MSPEPITSFMVVVEQPSLFVKPLVNNVFSISVTVSNTSSSIDLKAIGPVFFTPTSTHHCPAQESISTTSASKAGAGVGVNVGVGVGGGVKIGKKPNGPVSVAYSPHTQQYSAPALGLRMYQYSLLGLRPYTSAV